MTTAMAAAAMFVVGQLAACVGGGTSHSLFSKGSGKDAGLVPGDGGVWATSDSGTWFVPSNPLEPPLRALPTLEKLCTLRGGNLHGESKYKEGSQGTWIRDVMMILGPSGFRAKEPDRAEMTYTYTLPRPGADVVLKQAGSSGPRPKWITLSLAFERIDAVWPPASDGVPMDDPYFLNGIEALEIEAPECWGPTGQGVVTPCEECKQSGRDFFFCKDVVERIEDCYAR